MQVWGAGTFLGGGKRKAFNITGIMGKKSGCTRLGLDHNTSAVMLLAVE